MRHSLYIIHYALLAFSVFALVLCVKANAPAHPATLPRVVRHDTKAYAWIWHPQTQTWRLLPRNEARVLDDKKEPGKQHTGTLVIDGHHAVPDVPGRNVQLLFRKKTDFKTFPGLPENESGIEVTRLEIAPGAKPGAQIRTARLHRQGESSATFGENRIPRTVQKIQTPEGVFHHVQLARPLPPGRYALYLPDRAFEFESR